MIHFKIISPEKTIVDGKYDEVIIPGVDGDFSVLPSHTPFITIIRPGIISLFLDKKKTEFAIHDGFVTVDNDEVILTCDTIESKEDIDVKRAQDSKYRAEKHLKNEVLNNKTTNFRRAEFALKRSLARLELSKDER